MKTKLSPWRPLCLGDTVAVKTLRPRQNGRHFADDIFKCIFLNENVWILLKISLKFVPKFKINNIPALVKIMAWRRPGDKPLSEPMMVSLLTHICVAQPLWVENDSGRYTEIIFNKNFHELLETYLYITDHGEVHMTGIHLWHPVIHPLTHSLASTPALSLTHSQTDNCQEPKAKTVGACCMWHQNQSPGHPPGHLCNNCGSWATLDGFQLTCDQHMWIWPLFMYSGTCIIRPGKSY